MMKKKFVFVFGFCTFLFTACSLKYEDTVQVDSRVPEFVFENTTMTRYEDNAVTFEMNAELLEQYKNSNQTYAKKVSFNAYEDGEISTQGSCGLLFADSDSEIYKLYDEIQLFNYSESTNFFANVLKWNAKTEQLTSGRGDMVRIEKDDAVIRGTGFSASGIGKTFSFKGTVTGEIETESDIESEK